MGEPVARSIPSFIVKRDVLQKAHGEALMKAHLKRAGLIDEFTNLERLAFAVLEAAGYFEK